MSAPIDVLTVFDAAEVNAELAHRHIDAIQARKARAAVSALIEVARFAELLKFKQSTTNANAAFLDYRDCVHLQTIARAALARVQGEGA